MTITKTDNIVYMNKNKFVWYLRSVWSTHCQLHTSFVLVRSSLIDQVHRHMAATQCLEHQLWKLK